MQPACCFLSMYLFVCCCAGGQCERMQVACNSQQELQDWLDLLTKHTHTPSSHSHKPQSVCHTVSVHSVGSLHPVLYSHPALFNVSFPPPFQLPSHPGTPSRHSESRGGSSGYAYHTLPHLSSYGSANNSTPMWGPLEPPSTPKPWSLSCLRPAPPLRPSAALCYKEVLLNDILK